MQGSKQSYDTLYSNEMKCNADSISLHGILGSPLSRSTVMLGFIRSQKLGNVWYERIIRIGIRQQGTNGEQNFTQSQSRRPLILEDIETNTAIGIDVAVINFGSKVYLRRLERIIGWKMNVQKVHATCIGRIIGSHNGRLPMKYVIPDWPGGTIGRRILSDFG